MSMINSFKVFLPNWCCQTLTFTDNLSEIKNFNVVGTNLDWNKLKIKSDYQVCTLSFHLKDKNLTEKNEETSQKSSFFNNNCNSVNFKKILDYTINLKEEKYLCPRVPQIINKIENAINSSSLSDSALLLFLTSIIEEWTNKVKIWQFVAASKKNSSEQLNLSFNAENSFAPNMMQHEVFSHNFSNLSIGGGSSMHSNNTQNQLLMTIGVFEWDVPLLEFWASKFSQ